MENKNNKGINRLFKIMVLLFIVFLCLYSISLNGYVENINKDKTLYTEEQIKQFENDVLNGEEIDINKYTLPEQVDYSNDVSNLGENISDLIDYASNKALGAIVSFIGVLFK